MGAEIDAVNGVKDEDELIQGREAPQGSADGEEPPKIVVLVRAWLAHLIPRYVENRVKDVQLIRLALAQGDFESLRRIGHNLKGAGGFGFMAMTEIGVVLERAAQERDREGIRGAADELEDYLSRLEVAYR